MTIKHRDILNELARRNYADYVELVHNGRYRHGKFTRYLCRKVQDFVESDNGFSYEVLLLSVPPQHGKSMTITETLPSWYLGKNPDNRVIEISYNDNFAKRFTRRNRDKIEEYGQDLFGVAIGEPNTATDFVIAEHVGSFMSRGLTSGVTGEGCALMIIDDPIKNYQDADSETMRENLLDEWEHTYKSRLAPNGKVIVIQTRWHKEDLYGWMAENEPHVTVINFPVECEEETDVLGRKRGDPLAPEIGKGKEWLLDFKQSYTNQQGSRAWTALYLGRPTNEEGGIFKRHWWQYYEDLPLLGYKCISVDANFKEGKKLDNVAIQVWGKLDAKIYLIERYKAQIGFVETLELLDRIINYHLDYNAIFVEDKANGSAIIDVMGRRYLGVIPVQPEGGKEARAYAVSPIIEAGNVYIRREHYELVNEAADFPNSDHDDEVDAMTQALNKLRNIVAARTIVDPDRYNEDDQVDEILAYTG